MKKLISILFLTFLLLFVSIEVFAQFEGEIKFQVEDYTGRSSDTPSITLISAGERLFISSDKKIEVITSFRADGLLIRNDNQDFVFNTENDQALKVTKSDLDGLMSMIERYGGAAKNAETDRFDWETGVEETGNTKTHLGYEIIEFRVKGENEGQYASIWLTDDIKMNWGLMFDVWERIGNRFSDSELPVEMVMNPNSFPLLFEIFNGGSLLYKIESTSVETGNFDRTVLELPDDKALISLADLMMNMFRQQR